MIIYGKNVIKEAILNNRAIYKLYLDEKLTDTSLIAWLDSKGVKYLKTNKGELNHLTDNGVHQGIVADVKPYQTYSLEEILDVSKKQKFLILDELHDPHNLGAILRSAEATGVSAIVIAKKNQVPLNATVAKVSAGTIEHVAIVCVSNIYQTLLKLQENDVLVVGTDASATLDYRLMPKDRSVAIVLGNEGVGIRPLVKKGCDLLVSIPMKGKVNSLNVSVAAALMLYATLD